MTASIQQVSFAQPAPPPDAPARDRSGRRLLREPMLSSRPPTYARVIAMRWPARAAAVTDAPPRRPTPSPPPAETEDDPGAPPRRPRRRSGKRLILATIPVAGMERTQDGRHLVLDGGD